MRDTPDDGYSTVSSFSTLEEANIAAAALRAGGVPASLGNEHSATTNWTTIMAMNGIQVMVPTSMLAQARSVLNERAAWGSQDAEDPEDEPYEPPRRKDQWKARILLLWLLGPIVVLWGISAFRNWTGIAMRLFGHEPAE